MAKVKRYSAGNYVTSEDSNSGMEEAYNNAQEESRGENILKGMRDEAATVSRAKPKIVTKEELEKSGLSLRDYMNKQQGLTRRGDATNPRQQINFEYLNTPNAKSDTAAIIAKGQANNDADRRETEAAEAAEAVKSARVAPVVARGIAAPPATSFKDKVTKEALNSIKASGKKYPDMSVLQAPAKRAGMTAMGRKDSGFDLNSDMSYKQGGSVSSASRRADGIAMKGKTRGKIC
jgi:hypothetical protein